MEKLSAAIGWGMIAAGSLLTQGKDAGGQASEVTTLISFACCPGGSVASNVRDGPTAFAGVAYTANANVVVPLSYDHAQAATQLVSDSHDLRLVLLIGAVKHDVR